MYKPISNQVKPNVSQKYKIKSTKDIPYNKT
jgi:hypothetical protein